jgi:hypothetical protein
MDQGTQIVIVLTVFGIIVLITYLINQEKLDDPNNNSVVYASDIKDSIKLSDGEFMIDYFRQSGNEYRESKPVTGISHTIDEISKTLNKANIQEVYLTTNNSETLHIQRLNRSNGGKAEGKKLGYIYIRRVGAASEPIIEDVNSIESGLDQARMKALEFIDKIDSMRPFPEDAVNGDDKAILSKAQSIVYELQGICRSHPSINIQNLDQIELDLFNRQLADKALEKALAGNMEGKQLEADGNIEGAIKVYFSLMEDGVYTPFPYRRLAILAKKVKNKELEIKACEKALINVGELNSSHYKWFEDRLNKLLKTK